MLAKGCLQKDAWKRMLAKASLKIENLHNLIREKQ